MPFLLLSSLAHSLAWLVAGFLVCVTGLNPLLSILFFELPLLTQFKTKGYFENDTPYMVYLCCFGLFAFIFGLEIWLGLTYAHSDWPYFTMAIAVCAIINLISLNNDPIHRHDFIEDNTAYLSPLGYQELVRHSSPKQVEAPSQPAPNQKRAARRGMLGQLKRYLRIRIKIGRWEIAIE